MNLGALARSLSNSLRIAVGSKKQLETTPTASESPTKPATLSTPPSSSNSDSTELDNLSGHQLTEPVVRINPRRLPYKQTVHLILDKVSELEHTLYEDQQREFKLRMALEHQTERIHELNFSLDTEKQRNERLVQLLRGVDSDSSSESEPESQLLNGMRLHTKDELYGSISPMLMQQRYDELQASHRQTHRQLAKKDKAIKLLQCDLEVLRGKYDSICNDYRSEHRRLEALCTRYMHMQQKKKQQICILKETLGYASECILHAQMSIESCDHSSSGISEQHLTKFNQNLELFMRSLRNCCCLRKLQELERQQGLHVEQDAELPSPELSTTASSGFSSIGPSQVDAPKQKRRHRKRQKH
ncbi:uncharacterized protein LOC115769436 [Drosophila novamexicana]|uniref:uncharacterized protein LOC115769436 n=1 Tax=Drosophila novamexicana TaxID=47314 RepID=UPI0011E5B63F|nr:uncharacterized protein LOC115769436 [Drosophila novamexicana]